MYTPEALADLHARGHTSLRRLLEHCAPFSADELRRELDGFGYPSMHRSFAHVIGAEHYWVGVLHGVVDAEDRDDAYPTVEALEGWRGEVEARTRGYVDAASVEELNTPRPVTMWGGRTALLVPARVVVRTFAHLYQHQGQLVAMCRLLGRPATGLDFPLA
ncbi:MAG: DinB family protein [Planctomycetota bacterium]